MKAFMNRIRPIPSRRSRITATAIRSADGARIAVKAAGSGPALVMVDGALCCSGLGPGDALSRFLAPHFRVHQFDRRGRGASSDHPPYAVEREIEDLDAVVDAAGGNVFLFGISSGAILALKYACTHPSKVKKVCVYEAPCIVDDGHEPMSDDWARIASAVGRADPGAALRTFLRSVGLPRLAIAIMSLLPIWPRLKAIACTLPYDGAIVGPYQRGASLDRCEWEALQAPVQVLIGGKSPGWLQRGNRALCEALPAAECVVLAGQTHNVKPAVTAPALLRFFGARQG
jgi:pimeloyl-ACP methyl ester carboxylesterase